MVEKLCQYFRFSPREAHYFQDLVALSKEKADSPHRLFLLERLQRQHPKREFRALDPHEFQLIANWYSMAIREMVKLPDFSEDPAWIAGRLRAKVSITEIREALLRLQSLGLLARSAQTGKLTITSPQYDTTRDVPSEAIRRYHEATLDLSRQSIRAVPVSRRENVTSTLCISTQKIPLAKDLIRKFQEDFSRLIEASEDSEEVYQFQVQFFPMTHKNGGSHETQ